MSIERSGKSNSPFRYPGGKFYARKMILPLMPKDIQHYCEPFAGGASIFFAMGKSVPSHLNDLDSELMNTMMVTRDSVDDLIELLDGVEATKKNHTYYKNEYEPSSDVERAFRWYYLNRTSYSGIMNMQNCYWGYGDKYSMRPENWPAHLRQVSDVLQGVELTSLDFEQVIDGLPDGVFCFVDPPYFNADQDKFYTCSFTRGDHLRLRDVLKRNSERIQFLLTYDNTDEVIELYSDWTRPILDREWNYTIARTDDQKEGKKLADGHKGSRSKGKEAFILNYPVTIPTALGPHRGNREHTVVHYQP